MSDSLERIWMEAVIDNYISIYPTGLRKTTSSLSELQMFQQ
jgi:hypothetical protein